MIRTILALLASALTLCPFEALAQSDAPKFELVVVEKAAYRRSTETGEVWEMVTEADGQRRWRPVSPAEIRDDALRKRLFPGENSTSTSG